MGGVDIVDAQPPVEIAEDAVVALQGIARIVGHERKRPVGRAMAHAAAGEVAGLARPGRLHQVAFAREIERVEHDLERHVAGTREIGRRVGRGPAEEVDAAPGLRSDDERARRAQPQACAKRVHINIGHRYVTVNDFSFGLALLAEVLRMSSTCSQPLRIPLGPPM